MNPASPNHGERRDGLRPTLIVLHYTGMEDGPSARVRLCDPDYEVSAHWLIHEDGTAEDLVPEDRRAWHAGAGSWLGLTDINSRSIGIEIVNPGDRPFPEPQMAALERLLPQIMARWDIPAKAVIAHSDMAPGRKIDPGPRFDWRRLAHQGLSIWPEPGLRHAELNGQDLPFADSLDQIGYPPGDPSERLQAFRLRFRPWGSGPEDQQDRRIAAAVAAMMREH